MSDPYLEGILDRSKKPDPAPASPPTDAVALTIRDISELDYDTPVGQAHILMVTAEELRIILERRFPAEPALPQTDDIRVVCDDLREHGFPAYATLIGSLQAHIIALESRRAPEPSSPQALVCALKHADSIVGESSDALALRLLAEEVRRLSAEPDGIERAVRFVRQLARTSVAMDEDEAEERLRTALTKAAEPDPFAGVLR